ncbi:MAG: DUF6986 family protein [Nocardioidaceae bacterium]
MAGLPDPRLGVDDLAAVGSLASVADEQAARLYAGDGGGRQPVHTVYVPADAVTADLAPTWGRAARTALDTHAPTPDALAAVLDEPVEAAGEVWPLLLAKLETEPIEDLRIDLEDGYGARLDAEEDADAVAAARALATATADGTAPPYSGIRVKSLERATRARGLRTLDLVLGAMLEAGGLPAGWTVTLPKVTSVRQVAAMVEACARLERAYGLPDHRLTFEVQVETPQLILGVDGRATVAQVVHEADGRLTGLHFGTYDYTAALGVSAAYQAMDHPVAQHAKAVMAVAVAGTGVRLSDGSTNILPVGDTEHVHAAWALHARLVQGSLAAGYYQGWDLHPAQLVTRFVASYLFYRRGLDEAGSRLSAYLQGRSASAEDNNNTVLDEPATAQALAGFLLRGVDCGAMRHDELASLAGTEMATLRTLAARRVG